MYSETRRKLLHMAVVGLAFLLRVLTPAQAMLMAAVAIAMNLWLLPRLVGRSVFRPDERDGTMPGGIVLYPVAVLIAIVCLPHRLDLVAGAWAILGMGDGMATIVGRAVGRNGPSWPWNHRKSLAGSLAFVAAGASMSIVLMQWTAPALQAPPSVTFIVWASLAAAIVAALVESIDLRIDDNLSVTFTAAAVLWCASLVDGDAARASLDEVAGRLMPALIVNGLVAFAVMRARLVDLGGALAGAIVGMAIALGASWQGWMMLFATFLAAAVTSKVGERGKRHHGIAEERDGRRGAGNAIANCGVAAVAGVLSLVTPHPATAVLVLVTALVAGGSDTVASEIGKAMRGTTWSVLTFRRVPPGTPGAMSVSGTVAGVLGAAGLAAFGAAIGLVEWQATWIVVVAATAGALVESVLAATFEQRGYLTNDLLNFLNTAAAAAVAVALAG